MLLVCSHCPLSVRLRLSLWTSLHCEWASGQSHNSSPPVARLNSKWKKCSDWKIVWRSCHQMTTLQQSAIRAQVLARASRWNCVIDLWYSVLLGACVCCLSRLAAFSVTAPSLYVFHRINLPVTYRVYFRFRYLPSCCVIHHGKKREIEMCSWCCTNKCKLSSPNQHPLLVSYPDE